MRSQTQKPRIPSSVELASLLGATIRPGEELMKQREPGSQREGRELFERAMREVDPLAPSEVARGVPRPRRLSPAASPAIRNSKGRRGSLKVEVDGEWLTGLAYGVDRRTLRRLRRGQQPVEMEVDLHGFSRDEAGRVVRQALEKADQRGWRCIRIIHGRGHGSAAGPVLKRELPRWLEETPPAVEVVAFTTAGPRLGGTGATLVLLRGR